MGDFEETDWYEVAIGRGPDLNKVRFHFKFAQNFLLELLQLSKSYDFAKKFLKLSYLIIAISP